MPTNFRYHSEGAKSPKGTSPFPSTRNPLLILFHRTIGLLKCHYHLVREECLAPIFGAQKMQWYLVSQTINISRMMNPLRLLITKLSSLNRKLAMGAHSVVSKMNLLKYMQSGLHSEIKSASRVNPLGDIIAGVGVVLISPQNHVIAPMLTLTNPCSNDIAE